MKIQPFNNKSTSPVFKWTINQKITRYGGSMIKATEYYRDNGTKLVVVDTYYNGQRQSITKELFNKFYHMIKSKTIYFVNGKRLKGGKNV